MQIPPTTQQASSDLTKLCLPQQFRDSNRKLAWVNSICLLFLLIGVVGLKSPRHSTRPATESSEAVPVLLVPADQPANPKPPETPAKLEPIADEPEQPVVAAVVAADANAVSFAVPVIEPAAISPARFASAGPPINPSSTSSKSTPFIPSEADWGGHKLEYPPQASRRGYQGKVVLEIVVTPSGEVASVKVRESSGHKTLDDAALDHVRRYLRLRHPPGETRVHTLDMVFQLKP